MLAELGNRLAASPLPIYSVPPCFSQLSVCLLCHVGLHGDASSFDGHAYCLRTTLETANLGGAERAYINRINGDGTLKRVFLNTSDTTLSLDDAMTVNPTDRSVWIVIEEDNTEQSKFNHAIDDFRLPSV